MNLEPNVANAIKSLARNGFRSENWSPTRWRERQTGLGTASMEAAALFGDLSRCCNGMKMERQKENEQQNSRAHKAPESVRMLHAGIKHGVEPKQCLFECQWKMIATVSNGPQNQAPGFLDPSRANISCMTVSATKTLAWPVNTTP
jgi:hypothetical protein